MSIAEQLLKSPQREALIADAAAVLNSEVADKRGLSGKLVKGAFAIVKGLKPGFVPHAIDDLLDDFVHRVEPFYSDWKESGSNGSCRDYFVAHGSNVAEALLDITDQRARNSVNKRLVKTYNRLRPKGREHVVAAMPRVGDLIHKHASALE